MDQKSLQLFYMREHSNHIRISNENANHIQEGAVASNFSGLGRAILVIFCRNKQRVLQQAWLIWVSNVQKNAGLLHDYTYDLKAVLNRHIASNEARTEIEIEVLYKWILQTYKVDPSGIASFIYNSKSKASRILVLNEMRMETVFPGEVIIFQDTLVRPDDGHFTIINGKCELRQFSNSSRSLLQLLELYKTKNWSKAKALLQQAKKLSVLPTMSGFGEVATITNTKRIASVCAENEEDSLPAVLLIVPKASFIKCVSTLRAEGGGGGNEVNYEAVDFLRQSGLGGALPLSKLIELSSSMRKIEANFGDGIYLSGAKANSIYFIMVGDVMMNTKSILSNVKSTYSSPSSSSSSSSSSGDSFSHIFSESILNADPINCYILSAGSVLGNETLIKGRPETGAGAGTGAVKYDATAIVISEAAVLFEVVGKGLELLGQRTEVERYSALTYRDLSRWAPTISKAESFSIQSHFDTLQKAIQRRDPFRGIKKRSNISEEAPAKVVKGSSSSSSTTTTTTTRDKLKTISDPLLPGGDDLTYKLDQKVCISIIARHRAADIFRAVRNIDKGPSARTVIMEDIFDDQIERDKHKIDNSFDLKYLQVSDKFDRAALQQEKRFQVKEETDLAADSLTIKMKSLTFLASGISDNKEDDISQEVNSESDNNLNSSNVNVNENENENEEAINSSGGPTFAQELKHFQQNKSISQSQDQFIPDLSNIPLINKYLDAIQQGLYNSSPSTKMYAESKPSTAVSEKFSRPNTSRQRNSMTFHAYDMMRDWKDSFAIKNAKSDKKSLSHWKANDLKFDGLFDSRESLLAFMMKSEEEYLKIRKAYTSKYLWNTRFIKLNNDTKSSGFVDEGMDVKSKTNISKVSRSSRTKVIPDGEIDNTSNHKEKEKEEEEILVLDNVIRFNSSDSNEEVEDSENHNHNYNNNKNNNSNTSNNSTVLSIHINTSSSDDPLASESNGGIDTINIINTAKAPNEVPITPGVLTPKVLTEKEKELNHEKIIQQYESLINAEVSSAKYLEGRVRGAKKSRFGLGLQKSDIEELLGDRPHGSLRKSEMKEEVDSIIDWRKYCMQTALLLQNSGKKTLPCAVVPSTKLKGLDPIKVIPARVSAGKFGSYALLDVPPAADDVPNIAASSYLEVYKNNIKQK